MKALSQLTKAELIERLQAIEQKKEKQGDHGNRAQTALHDTEERMRAILETAVEGIITIDERGVIESLNRAAERIFGYAAAEVEGRNVNVLMPSPYRQEHDQYMHNYVRTGEAKIIGIGREVVGRRKDGRTFPMDLAVSEVRLADRRLFTGFVRDITDRKRAEVRQKIQYSTVTALAESESLEQAAPRVMQGICEVMHWRCGEFWSADHGALIVHHVQSWPVSANRNSVESGLSQVNSDNSSLPGRVWTTGRPEWMPNPEADPAFQLAPATLKNEIKSAIAFPVLLGAEVMGVLVFLSPEEEKPDDETWNSFSAIGNQIGQFIERKRAESKLGELARNLAEKNKELEAVVYVASHDLRSPLVNIQGFSKELAQACETIGNRLRGRDAPLASPELQILLSQDIPEAIEFILAGVKKIDGLLSGFLRYSRLGRAAIRPEPIQMNAMLRGIAQAMDFQIKRAGVQLEIQPLPNCIADPTQLNQVFSNLLDNAIKYLDPKRAGRIRVSGAREEGHLVYLVEDNGLGIAPEHQARVFEIFHRLDPSATEGEGLGLTIAQRILERHNGRIWVQSNLGQGSTFLVSIPG